MPRQRAIRFPDDLHDAIEAEARRRGHPWTFSSVVIDDERKARLPETDLATRSARAAEQARNAREIAGSVLRGSPSPSLERARRSIT